MYVLQMADGANVLVTGKGHVPFEGVLFETGSEKYAWMNSVVAVGKAAQVGGGISMDVFQVSSLRGASLWKVEVADGGLGDPVMKMRRR
jgi:hypothetical protein